MSKEPVVGDKLNYWPNGKIAANTQPETAVVAFVHSVNMTSPVLVNLAIVDHDGRPYSQKNVRLVQANDVQRTGQGMPELRFATWPEDSLEQLIQKFETDKEIREAAKKAPAKSAK